MKFLRGFVNNKFNPAKDYYNILEVDKSATPAEVKKSYYKLVKKYHPDKGNFSEDKIKQINEAYEVLSDDKVRKDYEAAKNFTEKSYNASPNTQNQKGTHYQSYQTQNPFGQQDDFFRNFYQQNVGRQNTGQYYKKTTTDRNGNQYEYYEFRSGNQNKREAYRDPFNGAQGVQFDGRTYTREDFEKLREEFLKNFYQNNHQNTDSYSQEAYSAKKEEYWQRKNQYNRDHYEYERVQQEKEDKAIQDFRHKVETAKEVYKTFREEWRDSGLVNAVQSAYQTYKDKCK